MGVRKRGFSQRRHLTRVALVITTLVVTACGGGRGGSNEAADAATTGDDRSWGPLAIVPPPEASGQALIAGTLKVTDECLLLDERGEDVLLVWPADRTRWNPESKTISFETSDGRTVTLADGDEVAFGGGGSSVEEDGLSAEDFVAGVEWVSEPAPSCVMDTRWFVGDDADRPNNA